MQNGVRLARRLLLVSETLLVLLLRLQLLLQLLLLLSTHVIHGGQLPGGPQCLTSTGTSAIIVHAAVHAAGLGLAR